MEQLAALLSSLLVWGGAKVISLVLSPWNAPVMAPVEAMPECEFDREGLVVASCGGPDDGAGLFEENEIPCMDCGSRISVDWDGQACWHLRMGPQGVPVWCIGSRKPTWELLW